MIYPLAISSVFWTNISHLKENKKDIINFFKTRRLKHKL